MKSNEIARPSLKPRMDRRRRLRLLLSYAPDWIITVAVTALFYLLDGVHGFRRNFSLKDDGIQYPYAVHERVPSWLLFVISLAAPFGIMPIINLLSVRSLWDWHNSTLGLILAWGLTGTFTNIVKITVGRPRPDLIDRCQPLSGSRNAEVYGLVDSSICTQTDMALMKDGFRSFFSGHSSLSFAGLGFLFFYGAGKLHLFDRRGRTGKAWIAFIPLVAASLVAISRTMDYRHHPTDVLTGSIVGLVVAHFSYRQYYPPLASPMSHHPYSPRIPYEGDLNRTITVTDGIHSTAHLAPYAAGAPSDSQVGVDGTVPRTHPNLLSVWGASHEHVRDGAIVRQDDIVAQNV